MHRSTIYGAGAAALLAGVVVWAGPANAAGVVASGHRPATCLDIRAGANDALLWSCHGGANQQFRFQTGSYGPILVQGRCLSTSGGAGASLIAASCNGGRAQRWVNTAEGFLRNEEGWCADVEGGGGAGARIIAWQCNRAGAFAVSNQRWSFANFLTAAELRSQPGGAFLAQQAQGVATGAPLRANGVIAAGGGNVIAAGGGKVIAAGGGNVIAAGGGNVLAPASGVIASGALN